MSSVNSAMSSRQSSRGTTPLPNQIPPVNPYRLPRFWRGFVVGGLTIPGLYGLYKLGSFAKNYLYNKFHKIPTYENRYIWYDPYNTPTPEPTPEPIYLSAEAYNEPPKHKHKRKYIDNNINKTKHKHKRQNNTHVF